MRPAVHLSSLLPADVVTPHKTLWPVYNLYCSAGRSAELHSSKVLAASEQRALFHARRWESAGPACGARGGGPDERSTEGDRADGEEDEKQPALLTVGRAAPVEPPGATVGGGVAVRREDILESAGDNRPGKLARVAAVARAGGRRT